MSLLRADRPLSLREALLPVITMAIAFGAGAMTLGIGGDLLIVVLLLSALVAGTIAIRHGHTWSEIQEATGEKLKSVLPVVLILLAVGALIGTWVLSGTIPAFVYWGIRLVSPEYIVLTSFLATAIMSTFTGTSWGSAGTVGVALMGTAIALDAPIAATAGAVVSGAYLGDKMSPLSDSTNICAIGAGANLYKHIRNMMYTATPSFIACLVVYTLAARLTPGEAGAMPASARVLLTELDTLFSVGWIAMIPAVVVIVAIVRRMPPALGIALSAAVAAVLGVALQGFDVQDAMTALVSGFSTNMVDALGADPASFSPAFRRLADRGGLYSMATTLVVVLAAFLLAAGMEVSGALDLLVNRLLQSVRSVFGVVVATMTAGATMIAMTSHGGVTGLVIGNLFQKAYDEHGLARENLARSVEDSVTITEPLMPWTVSAVYMATTLGVPTLEYAPWAVFCYGGPIFSLLLAAFYKRTRFGLLPAYARA